MNGKHLICCTISLGRAPREPSTNLVDFVRQHWIKDIKMKKGVAEAGI